MNSRDLILNSAATLFRTKGFASTSMRDIADASSMRAASVYHHFQSKDAIAVAVLDRALEVVFSEVKSSQIGLEEADYATRIERAIASHLRSIFEVDDYNGAAIRIFDQIPPDVAAQTKARRDEYIGYWKALLEEGQRVGYIRSSVDISLLRLFLFGAMNWAPQWYKEGRADIAQIAKNLKEVVINGVSDG